MSEMKWLTSHLKNIDTGLQIAQSVISSICDVSTTKSENSVRHTNVYTKESNLECPN